MEIPFEYKKGFTKFLNCKIDLSKRPLIPRPETEFWVKKAIKDLKVKGRDLKILDMFSGSGCVGIAVSKNIKNSQIYFLDIDEKAIEQIKINLKLNKISLKRCAIIKSNLFEKLALKRVEGYDFIFANPPYVAKERIKEVEPTVLKYEPKKALLAGKEGLFYIRKFLKEAGEFLKPEGLIYLEIDPQQKDKITQILKKYNYSGFNFYKDQFNKYRWVKIKK